jgi:hypothetical protein
MDVLDGAGVEQGRHVVNQLPDGKSLRPYHFLYSNKILIISQYVET